MRNVLYPGSPSKRADPLKVNNFSSKNSGSSNNGSGAANLLTKYATEGKFDAADDSQDTKDKERMARNTNSTGGSDRFQDDTASSKYVHSDLLNASYPECSLEKSSVSAPVHPHRSNRNSNGPPMLSPFGPPDQKMGFKPETMGTPHNKLFMEENKDLAGAARGAPPSLKQQLMDVNARIRKQQEDSKGNKSSIEDKYILNMTDLKIEKQIGAGGSAKVYKGKFNDLDVAVKRLDLSSIGVGKARQEFKREVNTLNKINHRNLVSFVGVAFDKQNFCIVTEF